MTPTVQAQLSAIEVQVDILRVQLQALRHALTEPPKATVAPCEAVGKAVDPEQCALHNEDARIDRSSFSDPQAWNCRGCGFEHRMGS